MGGLRVRHGPLWVCDGYAMDATWVCHGYARDARWNAMGRPWVRNGCAAGLPRMCCVCAGVCRVLGTFYRYAMYVRRVRDVNAMYVPYVRYVCAMDVLRACRLCAVGMP